MVPQAEHVSPQEPLPTASRRRPRLPQHRPEWSPLPQVLSGRANTLAGSSGVFCVQITSCQAQTGDPQDVEGFSVISEFCEKTHLHRAAGGFLLCRPPSSGGVGAAVLPGNRQASASETQALGSTQRRHGTPEVSSHPRLRTCPNTYFLE